MKKEFLIIILIITLIMGAVLSSLTQALADYPERPIMLITTFPVGGPVDVTAQAISEAAKRYLPHPLVLVNRPGGAGTIGTAEIIQAKADGYTLGITALGPLAIQPHLRKLPYGSPEDYTTIINVINNPVCLVVKSTSPWKNIQEFISHAQANPGKVRVGNQDPFSVPHLVVEQLGSMAKVDLKPVHFTSGAPGLAALLEENIEALSQHHGFVFPAVQAGKIRVLGVFEEKRNPVFPEAPTFKEMGYDITLSGYLLIIGPKGLPPKIVSLLHDAFKKAMEDPIFTGTMKAKGYDIFYEGPDEVKKRLMKDYLGNAKLLEGMKLKK